MKRKLVCCVLILCAALIIGTVPATADMRVVNVTVDGRAVDFGTQQPFIDSATGRTMIPLRIVGENLGAQVLWYGERNVAVIQKGTTVIAVTIGLKAITVNQVVKYLDAPAMMYDGKVFVPIRFISEAMGCRVEWDEDANCVNVFTDGAVTPPAQPVQPAPPALEEEEGIPWEFKAINEALPDRGLEISDRCLSNGLAYFINRCNSGNFNLMVRTVDQKKLEDVKKILKVFYPTKYEEAYYWMNEPSDHKDVYDGRTYECVQEYGQTVITIGRK